MKLSRYNWIVEHDNDVIAYNSFTGAMARIEPENVSTISELFSLEGNVDSYYNNIDTNLSKSLVHGGYVIDDGFDERILLKVRFNSSKYSGDGSYDSLTLVMTRRCNFRCTYCFESETLDLKDSITDEVLDRVVEIAKKDTGKTFSLTLYGGEPLLEYRKCIDICMRCKKAVNERDADFSASLITNGYLLTPRIAEQLSENGVKSVQITVDGSRETHNRNRPLKNGEGTYDRVMENIKTCADKIKIAIRMNIKEVDINEINALKNTTSKYTGVQIHFAPVDLKCQGDSSSFDRVKKKLASIMPAEEMGLYDIHARIAGCGATRLKPSVVLPNGDLVRCWEQVDGTKSSSNILDESKTEDYISFLNWVGWDPYLPDTECYQCRYLPNCGGGCPLQRIVYGEKKCTFYCDEDYKKSIIGSYISLKKQKMNKIAGE